MPVKSNKGTKKPSTSKTSKTSKTKKFKAENKPLTKPMIGASIGRIKRLTVETGWLTAVYIEGDGVIELDNSWVDFILTMLGMVHSKNENKFMGVLVDNHVLSDGINVNKKYIEYPETSEIDCEVYKLRTSEYYVEFKKNGDAYIQAIKGLLKALDIDIKTVTFDITPLNTEINGVNTTYNNVKQVVVTESMEEIYRKNRSNLDIVAITLFGYRQEVKSASQALISFMFWALASYGEVLENAGVKNSMSGVGMTTAAHIDEYSIGFTTVKVGKYYLYCCEDSSSCIKYIRNVAEHIGVPLTLIELEYKTLELIK